MKRLRTIVRKMWTGIKSAGRGSWDFIKSKEGRQMVIQLVLIAVRHFFGQ